MSGTLARPGTSTSSERSDRSADQPADVPTDRDVRDRERDQQVQTDPDAETALHQVEAAVPRHHRGRPHQPEDRARGAHGEAVGRQQQGPEGAAQERHEVDQPEAPLPERGLDQRAEDPEREHVREQVEGPGVEEAGSDEAPVLAVGDRGLRDPAIVGERAAVGPRASAEQRADADDHVDPDQDVGEHRLARQRAHRSHLGALARALGAAHSDGRGRHAVRADRPLAVGAAHARLALRVAVADLHQSEATLATAARSQSDLRSVPERRRAARASRTRRRRHPPRAAARGRSHSLRPQTCARAPTGRRAAATPGRRAGHEAPACRAAARVARTVLDVERSACLRHCLVDRRRDRAGLVSAELRDAEADHEPEQEHGRHGERAGEPAARQLGERAPRAPPPPSAMPSAGPAARTAAPSPGSASAAGRRRASSSWHSPQPRRCRSNAWRSRSFSAPRRYAPTSS